MRQTRACIALMMLLMGSFQSAAMAAEWGSLKGRFVVEGTVPQPKPLTVGKDAHCIEHEPIDETIVVDSDGSLANVVVYIRLGRRDKIDVHPDYQASLTEPVDLDNMNCRFVPHVTTLRTGQPLMLKNSDPVGHNTNVGIFNQIIASGTEVSTKIDRDSPMPMPVSCNIHPFMKGYVLVQDHPYMAVSAADGTFEIKNLPAGKQRFTFWHEVPNFLEKLDLGIGTTGRRGDLEITISANETIDLGDIQISSELFR